MRKDQDLTAEGERLDKAIVEAVSKEPSKRDNIAVGYRPLVARVNWARENWTCINERAYRRPLYGAIAAAARITTELLTFSLAPTRVIVQASAQREVVPSWRTWRRTS